jgi:DNA-binding XRE family transcriptional regulator
MKTLDELKARMLALPATREAYNALGDEFELAHQLIEARTRAQLTQTDVAQRMGTTQSVIARLEGGKRPPSLRTMQRYAKAVGGRVVLRIEPMA